MYTGDLKSILIGSSNTRIDLFPVALIELGFFVINLAPSPWAPKEVETVAKRGNLTEVAYRAIKECVVKNYVPGQPLAQQDLANKLGISKTPVREALRRLAEEGLVRQVPNRGYWMAELSEQDIKEIYEVREALEGMAARLAALKIAPDELARLRESFASVRADGAEGDENLMEEIGDQLHQAILKSAGNGRIIRVLNSINGQLDIIKMMGRRIATEAPLSGQSAFEEHLEIMEALIEQDPDSSEQAMRRHLHHSKVRMLTSRLSLREDLDFLQEEGP